MAASITMPETDLFKACKVRSCCSSGLARADEIWCRVTRDAHSSGSPGANRTRRAPRAAAIVSWHADLVSFLRLNCSLGPQLPYPPCSLPTSCPRPLGTVDCPAEPTPAIPRLDVAGDTNLLTDKLSLQAASESSNGFFLMAGPNVIQSEEHCLKMCGYIKAVCDE